MALNLGVKIWGDVKGLIDGLKSGEKSLDDFSRTAAKDMKSVYAQLKSIEKAYYDVASSQGANSQAAKNLQAAYNKLDNELKQVKTSLKGSQSAFGGLKTELTGIAAGYLGFTAITAGLGAFFKTAIQGAMDDEKALAKLTASLDGNNAAVERMVSLKDKLLETTIFTEDEINGAINLGVALGRSENQIRNMIPAAMGLAQATGVDLQTAMQQLNGTYEGSAGKLAKLDSRIGDLTESELRNGKAVDILNERVGKLATEGIDTASGQVIMFQKNWENFSDSIGNKVLPFLGALLGKINQVMKAGGGASTGSFTGDFAKKQMDDFANANESGKQRILKYNEELKASYYKMWQGASNEKDRAQFAKMYDTQIELVSNLKKTYTDMNKSFSDGTKAEIEGLGKRKNAWDDYVESMKKSDGGRNIIGPTANAYEINTGNKYTGIDKMTPKEGLVSITQNAPAIMPVDTGNKTVQALGAMDSAMQSIGSRLGGLYSQFSSVFSSISQVVTEAANKGKDSWKGMAEGILGAISGVMQMIGSIIAQGYEQRMQAVDSYYANEKEKIENSSLPEAEKRKRMEKMDKEQEKKRKELMRQQAKDQKAVSIIQAVIAGALAVVTAYSAGPITGIVLAAIVGALAATQIAMIASQPLPALASGGLAFGPTAALVGEYPNASSNPEVIAPLDKLRSMLSESFGGGQLSARVAGSDLLFVLESANNSRTRTRGF